MADGMDGWMIDNLERGRQSFQHFLPEEASALTYKVSCFSFKTFLKSEQIFVLVPGGHSPPGPCTIAGFRWEKSCIFLLYSRTSQVD